MQFAVIVQDQRAAVRRNHHLERSGNRDLPIGGLAVRGADDAFRNFQSDLVRAIRGKSNCAARNQRMHHIGFLRQCGRARSQQVNLASTNFHSQRSAFFRLDCVAGVHGRAYRHQRCTDHGFLRLRD